MIQLNSQYKPIKTAPKQMNLNSEQKFTDITKNDQSAFENQFAQIKQNYYMSDKQRLDKIKEQSYEMETELLKIMIGQMYKTVNKTGFIDGGQTEEIFTGMIQEEYAKTMSKSSDFGLANAIYQNITGLYR